MQPAKSRTGLLIEVRTWLYPSETKERVVKALSAVVNPVNPEFIPPIHPSSAPIYAVVCDYQDVKALQPLYARLRSQRIVQTARQVVAEGTYNDTIEFFLHKQAAAAGQIHFCDKEGESPLGSIRIHITGIDPSWFLDWLTPQTENGHIIREISPFLDGTAREFEEN